MARVGRLSLESGSEEFSDDGFLRGGVRVVGVVEVSCRLVMEDFSS